MRRIKRSKPKRVKIPKAKRAKKSPAFKYAFNPATVSKLAKILRGGSRFIKNKFGKFSGSKRKG